MNIGRHDIVVIGGMIGMIGSNHPTNGDITLVGGMMDIYCLGAKTWLICSSKETNLSNIPFGDRFAAPEGCIGEFGLPWAANQLGFRAAHAYH